MELHEIPVRDIEDNCRDRDIFRLSYSREYTNYIIKTPLCPTRDIVKIAKPIQTDIDLFQIIQPSEILGEFFEQRSIRSDLVGNPSPLQQSKYVDNIRKKKGFSS